MGKTVEKTINTKPKLLIASALALVACYIFASLAIDTAKYLYYLLATLSFILAVKYLVRTLTTHDKN